ncbi:MAG: hypothetical protein PHR30_13300 [Gallionellaceae bacterium]|nr:hypothetical protein [Gallionellaceae bacterium]
MTDELIQGEYAPDDFFRAFAIAMLRWQYIEHELYLLFHALILTPLTDISGALYYAQTGFGPKLRLVDIAAKVALDKPLQAQWRALRMELDDASLHRNILAHLTAIPEFGEGDSIQLVLAPALLTPMQLRRKHPQKYDAEGCERIAVIFDELSQKVASFHAKVRESCRSVVQQDKHDQDGEAPLGH